MTTTTVPREMTLTTDSAEAASQAVSAVMSEEEFRAFYDRSARGLWLYLARITGDRQLADDLVQEAFYRFYRAGATHQDERHRRNSLFRIGTNLARDSYRRRRHAAEDQLPEEEMASKISSGVDEREDLTRALAQLKPQQREMLWLAYAHGSSHEEIASIIGVTPGSVKSLLLRARRKLAGILGIDPCGRRSE
jgi:RNA polymerase sigma-70 factor (ECF subfamily)